MSKAIQHFLHQWHFSDHAFWRQLNPKYEAFSAPTPSALIALLRVSIPAIGHARASRIAEAVRLAGYKVVEVERGVYIERGVGAESSAAQPNAQVVGAT